MRGKVPAPSGAGFAGNEGFNDIIRTEGGVRRRTLGSDRLRARIRSMGRTSGELNSFSLAPWWTCNKSSVP